MNEAHALTELQVAILRVLWDAGEASTQEIHKSLEADRGLALTTVATLLSRLEKRGVLSHRKQGRQYVYKPLISRKDVRRSKIRELTETLFEGDPAELIHHLVRSRDTDAEDLARIKAMIAEAEAAGGS